MNRMALCSIASCLIGSSAVASPTPPSSEVFQDCPACPQMKVVPPGAFQMGAAPKWEDKPGRTWRAPGYIQDKHHPVVCINWNDAKSYAQWLSATTGQRYRLLTEAEWEYLAHAGGVRVSHDAANYGAEAECCKSLAEGKDRWITTAPVGSFAPDALGLHDIRGNVWEWLEDCYHDDYAGAPADGSARTSGCSFADNRTVRGASWGDPSHMLRVSYRLRAPLVNRYFTLGFRVARDIP